MKESKDEKDSKLFERTEQLIKEYGEYSGNSLFNLDNQVYNAITFLFRKVAEVELAIEQFEKYNNKDIDLK